MIQRRIALLGGAGLLTVTFAPAALAYVGPGAGLGVLSALFAMIAAVVVTIVGLLLWPLRAILRRRKAKAAEIASSEAVHPAALGRKEKDATES